MKILVTGSNGLLGQKIIKLLNKRGQEYLATSKGENRNSNCPDSKYTALDITEESQVHALISEYAPSHVIHTAAMTNVDACELNPEDCKQVNVLATKYLFEASVKVNAHFELLSTDFVFDGEDGPYSEDQKVNPLSVYAQSKVDAENLLLSSDYENWSIARTIIVYGTAENLSRSNIILWALEALRKGGPLNIVNDQFRSPTWAEDLAWGCLEILNRNEKGVFHLSGGKVYSIIDLVKAIAKHEGLSTDQITEMSSSTLNQPAKRPPRTGFILDKAKEKLGYAPTSLEDSLELLKEELKA